MKNYIQQIFHVLKDMGARQAIQYINPSISTWLAFIMLVVLVFLFPENEWSQFNRDSAGKLINTTTSSAPPEPPPVAIPPQQETITVTEQEQSELPTVTQTAPTTMQEPIDTYTTQSSGDYPQEEQSFRNNPQYYPETPSPEQPATTSSSQTSSSVPTDDSQTAQQTAIQSDTQLDSDVNEAMQQ